MTIGSIKNSNIFIQSIFREPIPLIENIETSHSDQSTLNSGTVNAFRADQLRISRS